MIHQDTKKTSKTDTSPLQLLQTLLPPGDITPSLPIRYPDVERRRDQRLEKWIRTRWDFFTLQSGSRSDGILNLSQSGCLLISNEAIEMRRWIRIAIPRAAFEKSEITGMDRELGGLTFTLVGRVIRRRKIQRESPLFYGCWEHGIQFLQPINAHLEALIEESLKENLEENRTLPV